MSQHEIQNIVSEHLPTLLQWVQTHLQAFFERNGTSLPITTDPEDYLPGDIVSWMLPGNLPHIGVVSDVKHASSGVPLVVHNIGFGPKRNDALFAYTITGHYRYLPAKTE